MLEKKVKAAEAYLYGNVRKVRQCECAKDLLRNKGQSRKGNSRVAALGGVDSK